MENKSTFDTKLAGLHTTLYDVHQESMARKLHNKTEMKRVQEDADSRLKTISLGFCIEEKNLKKHIDLLEQKNAHENQVHEQTVVFLETKKQVREARSSHL